MVRCGDTHGFNVDHGSQIGEHSTHERRVISLREQRWRDCMGKQHGRRDGEGMLVRIERKWPRLIEVWAWFSISRYRSTPGGVTFSIWIQPY